MKVRILFNCRTTKDVCEVQIDNLALPTVLLFTKGVETFSISGFEARARNRLERSHAHLPAR
jgi:hypothetical protein